MHVQKEVAFELPGFRVRASTPAADAVYDRVRPEELLDLALDLLRVRAVDRPLFHDLHELFSAKVQDTLVIRLVFIQWFPLVQFGFHSMFPSPVSLYITLRNVNTNRIDPLPTMTLLAGQEKPQISQGPQPRPPTLRRVVYIVARRFLN